jgi:hypothetical protein
VSERGIQLRETADRQISELIGLFSAQREAALSLPCPGREKLGNGTVAALALHTADNYLRIAGFLQATSQMPGAKAGPGQGSHRIPRFLLARGHRPRGHAESGHDEGTHDGQYAAENVDLHGLLGRLSAGRDALSRLADLTDERLDTVPPTGSFRFCDGQRTLEQVVGRVLNHQGHQVDAMKAAIT